MAAVPCTDEKDERGDAGKGRKMDASASERGLSEQGRGIKTPWLVPDPSSRANRGTDGTSGSPRRGRPFWPRLAGYASLGPAWFTW